jgi:hypothetical protein
MKAFKLIIGILAAYLLTAANVMAYEVVIHNYSNEPMQVDITGENWQPASTQAPVRYMRIKKIINAAYPPRVLASGK